MNITPEQYLSKFKEITEEMYEVTRRKNSDYTADSGDAYANFKLVETLGVCSVEAGFLTRMTDKISRLAGLAKGKDVQVKDEKYADTLTDLAVYCILLRVYLEEKEENALVDAESSTGTDYVKLYTDFYKTT